ncbi:hypothetical protein SLG_06330 [Sphingobium sp. SYK-6]|uniref:nucleotidyltransferase family protein n=1 Tax=Sphingobium sp. (strain NBRC 103272 / SYK-6) TaxID=627192 RepID=UPI000227688C|nr:nucleotidyltransferase family protein [Sphingobium sp. SYK-6]BAK65308.1 hypothetical protein SLG_06330 [Sphingobium sp. SYK-6]
MLDIPGSQDPPSFDPPPEAAAFYADSLKLLNEWDIPYLLSGTYALTCHTGVVRPTKDIDIFCKPGDAPRLLARFKESGYDVTVEDERWIAKVWSGDNFFDVIFNMSSASIPITDAWFVEANTADVYGTTVRVTPPTEFIVSKVFIQDRYRYDGADVAHTILKKHDQIDWQRLLSLMELHWEVLFIHILNFRFIYPTERHLIPRWLFDTLLERIHAQAELPAAKVRICRGRLFSPRDYLVDISEWGFADLVGKGMDEKHERHL